MIHLITGVPGSGKTLYAVSLLEGLKSSGRPIFTDIDGYASDPPPVPWYDAPLNSIVVYDECQRIFPPDSKGRARDEAIKEMEVHRHKGIDLILITQRPGLVHSHVRALVTKHSHLVRIHGSSFAYIFTRDGIIGNTSSRSELNQCDKTTFKYPRSIFSKYTSAEVHTKTSYVPTYIKYGLSMIILAAVIAIYLFSSSASFWTGESVANADVGQTNIPVLHSLQKEPVLVESPSAAVPPSPPVYLGCVYSPTRCYCYTPAMVRSELTPDECTVVNKTLAVAPLPRQSPP